MVRKIIQIGDPLLYQKSVPIPKAQIASREISALITDLLDTCNREKESTAGLSAVQIGVTKRIFIARLIDDPQDSDENPVWEVFINPKLKVLDERSSQAWEGCLSIGTGNDRLFGPVDRPKRVRVEYTTQTGEQHSVDYKNYMAHIVQHEQDHLDGKLFLQYIKDPNNIWKSKDLDDYIDRHERYPPVV